MKILKQDYRAYTSEDKQVWKTLFERQLPQLQKVASEKYLQGITDVGFIADKIPDFKEVEQRLDKTTRWKLEVVPNIIPEREFFQLLSKKKFSATTWLRKMSQLNYLEEPDMFHDVFGHVPLLSNRVFCDFFHGLSQLGVKYSHSDKAMQLLGRMYWFTIEFGLIRENGSTKIYGAGILSSHGETKHCLSEEPQHFEFDVRKILSTPYQNDRIQDKYFVIDSYKQLFNSLDEIEMVLLEML